MTTAEQTSHAAAPPPATPSPWMSVRQAAAYAGNCYDTVLLACQAYISGDRSPRALKCSQRGHKCRHKILRADVDRWNEGLPPSRATRVA